MNSIPGGQPDIMCILHPHIPIVILIQLEELLERECESQVSRIMQGVDHMQTRWSFTAITLASLRVCIRPCPSSHSSLVHHIRQAYKRYNQISPFFLEQAKTNSSRGAGAVAREAIARKRSQTRHPPPPQSGKVICSLKLGTDILRRWKMEVRSNLQGSDV